RSDGSRRSPCRPYYRPNGLMLSRGAAPPSGGATRSVAQNERRKPRASERRYVGSCNELGGGGPTETGQPRLLSSYNHNAALWLGECSASLAEIPTRRPLEWKCRSALVDSGTFQTREKPRITE